MFKDLGLPNFAGMTMGVKDKLVGNNQRLIDEKGELHIEKVNPGTISSEIDYQVEIMAKAAYLESKTFGKDTKPAETAILNLYKAKNTVDAIRLNGRFAKISQEDRISAATTLADWLVKPVEIQANFRFWKKVMLIITIQFLPISLLPFRT